MHNKAVQNMPSTLGTRLVSSELVIVDDSQGDDSDYDFEQDLVRFRKKQETFKREMERSSQPLPRCRTREKDKKYGNPSSRMSYRTAQPPVHRRPAAPRAAIPLTDDDHDSSEDDIISFLKRPSNPGTRSVEPVEPKFTIADILEQTKRNKARDLEIHRAQQLLERSELEGLKPTDALVGPGLNSCLESSDGNPSLLNILKPVTTTKLDTFPRKWSFFTNVIRATENIEPNRRPLTEIWGPIIALCPTRTPSISPNDDRKIRDFLISGSMADSLRSNALKLEPRFQRYLLDELCLQPDEDLCIAYLDVAISLREQLPRLLDEKMIKRLFRLLGGSNEALDLGTPLQTAANVVEDGLVEEGGCVLFTPNWWNISLVLRLFDRIAKSLIPEQLTVIWGLVIRLSLDDKRLRERKCHGNLADLMETLLDQFASRSNHLAESVLLDMQSLITEPRLQIRILDVLPVTSVFSHGFRKRLARGFFLNNPVYLKETPDPSSFLGSILIRLASADVKVSKGGPYIIAQNTIDIANIAVDDARWCIKVPATHGERELEPALGNLISRLRQARELIQDGGDLNIEKSNAKDSFAKLILRLECIHPKTRVAQTLMESYFRTTPTR